MIKHFAAAIAAFTLAGIGFSAPISAQAQPLPSYAEQAPAREGQIRGRITSFNGRFDLTVRDERGFIDNVRLHRGTIIYPTGITLAPGMVVSILGYNEGSYFGANEVDTPYRFSGGVPYFSGHPWDYYGPTVDLGFYFGNPGWWHGGAFYGPHHYAGGVRVYDSVRFHEVYRGNGGTYRGRDYVAPPERGGYDGGRHAPAPREREERSRQDR